MVFVGKVPRVFYRSIVHHDGQTLILFACILFDLRSCVDRITAETNGKNPALLVLVSPLRRNTSMGSISRFRHFPTPFPPLCGETTRFGSYREYSHCRNSYREDLIPKNCIETFCGYQNRSIGLRRIRNHCV